MAVTIFLDIDGVLNRSEQWRVLYSLHDECIRYFCEFVNAVKGEVVLISSWKDGFIASLDEGNTGQIKELERRLAVYGVSIKGKTVSYPGKKRDFEIGRYIAYNKIESYIIIDDDTHEYAEVSEHNYFIDAKTGFSKKDIRKCMKKLI